MHSIVAVPKYSSENLLPQWLNRIIIIKSIYIKYIHIWLNRHVFILGGNRSQQPPGSSTLKSIAESGCYQIRLFFIVCRPKCSTPQPWRPLAASSVLALPGPTWTAFVGHDVLISPSQRLMRIIRKPNTHPLYLPVSLVNMWVFFF